MIKYFNSQNIVVFLAFGNKRHFEEAICSITSIYHCTNRKSEFKTVIFRDDPNFFENRLNNILVEYIVLTQEKIKEWVGGYIYKLKIKVLFELCDDKNPKSNLIFIDTDTLVSVDIMKLFECVDSGELLMHTSEYSLSSKLDIDFFNFLSKDNNEEKYQISLDSFMYNSGVIGINSSQKHLLVETLELIDRLWEDIPSQLTIEQIALGTIFSKNGNLSFADDYILHYWFFKDLLIVLKKDFILPPIDQREITGKNEIEFFKELKDTYKKWNIKEFPTKILELLYFYFGNTFSVPQKLIDKLSHPLVLKPL